MCGIYGSIGSIIPYEKAMSICNLLKHRGPDDGNVWKGDCIFLYIDWENKKTGAPDCKPNLSFMNKEA